MAYKRFIVKRRGLKELGAYMNNLGAASSYENGDGTCTDIQTGTIFACSKSGTTDDPWAGWTVILSMISAGTASWLDILNKKNQLVSQGFMFPSLTGSTYQTQYNQLKNMGLSDDKIQQILGGGTSQGIPTWVWVALASAGVLILLPIIMKKEKG